MQDCAHALRAVGRGARGRDGEGSTFAPHRRRKAGRCRPWVGSLLLLGAFAWSTSLIAAESAGDSSFNDDLAAQAGSASNIDDELHVDVLSEGESSRRLRKETEEAIPLNRLTPTGRKLADAVLSQVSLHRRLPVVRCETDSRVVQFFFQHPDVAVGIWRAMDISDMQLAMVGAHRYRTDSGDGSTGTLSVLICDPDQQLIHCEGMFKSPVLSRAIQASALMWVRAEYQRDADGREFAKCTADVFVAFPSATVETAARVISPVSNRIADRNFHEVTMFVRMMHLGMTRQPGWIEQLAANLSGITPERKQALLDLTAKVYVDAQRKLAQAGGQTLTPEGLRLPIRRESEAEAAAATSGDAAATPPVAAKTDTAVQR
jgi:hypothetical protein